MGRRQFNREYKVSAVKLVLEDQLTVSNASKLLNLSDGTLYRWVQEYEEYGEKAFPGKGSAIYHQLYKQKILERENQALKEEVDLLKKYRAFLKQKKK